MIQFAPWISMSTIDSHLRSVKAGNFMVDCDVSEMILNFLLEPEFRPYAGVDLSQVFSKGTLNRG